MATAPIISLSTSCFRGYDDGYAICAKAAEYGFEYVELGHGTTVTLVDGILKALSEGVIKVSSLHNFCPVPPFAGPPSCNLFSPATKNASESAQWARHTLNTISFAKEAGAKRIAAHAGELGFFFQNPEYKIRKFYEKLAGAKKALALFKDGDLPAAKKEAHTKRLEAQIGDLSAKYEKIKAAFLKKLEPKIQKADEFILENVRSVHQALVDAGVILGIENRDGWMELPFDTDFANFTDRLVENFTNARAWIDIGHAQIKAQRGIIGLETFLESLRGKICAWHIHDTTALGADHKPLGKGSTDFGLVKKYFDAGAQIFVLELSHASPPAEIINSRKILEGMF